MRSFSPFALQSPQGWMPFLICYWLQAPVSQGEFRATNTALLYTVLQLDLDLWQVHASLCLCTGLVAHLCPFYFGMYYCSTGLFGFYWICLEIIEASRKSSSSKNSNLLIGSLKRKILGIYANLHLSTYSVWRKHAFSGQSDQQPLRKMKQPHTFHQCCIFHTQSICKLLIVLIISLSVQSDLCCKGCSLATPNTYAVWTMKRKHCTLE